MVAVARADRERDEVARLDRELFDRADLHFLAALRRRRRRAAGGSPLVGVRATRSRRCRIPGGRASPRPRRASSPSTGLRQPTAARSVGDGWTATPCGFMLPGMRTCWSDELASKQRRLVAAPAVDEVVAAAARELLGEVAGQVDGVARADAEVVEPGPQARPASRPCFRASSATSAWPRAASASAAAVEVLRRVREEPLATRRQVAGDPADVPQAGGRDGPARPAWAAARRRSHARCRPRRRSRRARA